MKRLHTEIAKKYAAKPGFQVLMPGNCDTVALEFAEERSARAIGNVRCCVRSSSSSFAQLTLVLLCRSQSESSLTGCGLAVYWSRAILSTN